jgi:tRNA G10  N-methylase Trm11
MKYLFVLGRNIELSKQEVLNYFEKEENPILEYSISKNGMLIEIERRILEGEIDNFGGILSIGEILVSGTIENLDKKLDDLMIYSGKGNKLNYVVWNFSENYEKIEEYLKKRFKGEKLKATLKHLSDEIELQGGEKANVPSSKLLNEEYFIFNEKNIDYFGKIIQHCGYEKIEQRDMEKPVRRESLAISPRLAKIMINLAQVRKRDTLFDPFCGVGTILQEALLEKIKVFGVDIDKEATKGAKENMKWFGFSEEDYSIVNFDSKKVNLGEISVIVTEPDLGKTLKKIPTKEEAKKTLINFEKLMVQVINNVSEKVEGRIVFTSPFIRIGKKRVECNIENICSKTGYSEVIPGIEEYRGNQIVGRKIFVLKRE